MKDFIINLDKPRKLRFGFKALRLLRQKYGERSIEALMEIPVDEVPVFAWAGLKWGEDKGLTLEQVEDLMDEAVPDKYTIMEVITLIMGALSAQVGIDVKKAQADALKLKKEKEKKEAEKKPAPTGTVPSSRKPKK